MTWPAIGGHHDYIVGQMKADKSTQLNYDPTEDEKILKEIRERVQAIPSSTPYLDLQKELEKQAKALAAQMASARAEVIPDAGHLVFLEKPREFNELMLGFMAK